MLTTYECRRVDSPLMGFAQRHSAQTARHECCRERITGTYRIHDLRRRRGYVRCLIIADHIATRRTAGHDHCSDIKTHHERTCDIGNRVTRQTVHTAEHLQFIIIYLQNIAPQHRQLQQLRVIEILTQIGIENYQRIILLRYRIHKTRYSLT